MTTTGRGTGQDVGGTPNNITNPNLVVSHTSPTNMDNSDSFGAVSHVKDIDMVQPRPVTDHAQPEANLPESTKPSTAPMSFTLDDPDIAQYFLDWMRSGIRDGKIYINRSNALIHIVKEGLLIVSPLAFKKFISSHPFLLDSGKSEDKITITIQSRLKKMMTMANFHRQTEKGLNIHSYQITGTNKTAIVRGWLLPVSVIYGDMTPPGINTAVENISRIKGYKRAAK